MMPIPQKCASQIPWRNAPCHVGRVGLAENRSQHPGAVQSARRGPLGPPLASTAFGAAAAAAAAAANTTAAPSQVENLQHLGNSHRGNERLSDELGLGVCQIGRGLGTGLCACDKILKTTATAAAARKHGIGWNERRKANFDRTSREARSNVVISVNPPDLFFPPQRR